MIRFSILTACIIVYLVLMNYFGQQLIDKTEEVFQVAYYNTDWYTMPSTFRRYILMIQNRSTERKTLTAGKMGKVSLEAAGIVNFY